MNSIAANLNVVSVPSPLVDRRALSQAWYDALHLAEHGSKGRKPTGTFREGRSIFLRSQDGESKKSASRFFQGWKNRAFQSGMSLRRAAVQNRFERRAPVTKLAKEIAAKARDARVSRFSITLPEGRVVVAIARQNERVRMVAFAPPALRERVEKALAQARYAVACAR